MGFGSGPDIHSNDLPIEVTHTDVRYDELKPGEVDPHTYVLDGLLRTTEEELDEVLLGGLETLGDPIELSFEPTVPQYIKDAATHWIPTISINNGYYNFAVTEIGVDGRPKGGLVVTKEGKKVYFQEEKGVTKYEMKDIRFLSSYLTPSQRNELYTIVYDVEAGTMQITPQSESLINAEVVSNDLTQQGIESMSGSELKITHFDHFTQTQLDLDLGITTQKSGGNLLILQQGKVVATVKNTDVIGVINYIHPQLIDIDIDTITVPDQQGNQMKLGSDYKGKLTLGKTPDGKWKVNVLITAFGLLSLNDEIKWNEMNPENWDFKLDTENQILYVKDHSGSTRQHSFIKGGGIIENYAGMDGKVARYLGSGNFSIRNGDFDNMLFTVGDKIAQNYVLILRNIDGQLRIEVRLYNDNIPYANVPIDNNGNEIPKTYINSSYESSYTDNKPIKLVHQDGEQTYQYSLNIGNDQSFRKLKILKGHETPRYDMVSGSDGAPKIKIKFKSTVQSLNGLDNQVIVPILQIEEPYSQESHEHSEIIDGRLPSIEYMGQKLLITSINSKLQITDSFKGSLTAEQQIDLQKLYLSGDENTILNDRSDSQTLAVWRKDDTGIDRMDRRWLYINLDDTEIPSEPFQSSLEEVPSMSNENPMKRVFKHRAMDVGNTFNAAGGGTLPDRNRGVWEGYVILEARTLLNGDPNGFELTYEPTSFGGDFWGESDDDTWGSIKQKAEEAVNTVGLIIRNKGTIDKENAPTLEMNDPTVANPEVIMYDKKVYPLGRTEPKHLRNIDFVWDDDASAFQLRFDDNGLRPGGKNILLQIEKFDLIDGKTYELEGYGDDGYIRLQWNNQESALQCFMNVPNELKKEENEDTPEQKEIWHREFNRPVPVEYTYRGLGGQYFMAPRDYDHDGVKDEFHSGIDISRNASNELITGAPVSSIYKGKVIYINRAASGGVSVVFIEHQVPATGYKYISGYKHMSDIPATLEIGKEYPAGTLLGKASDVGSSGQNHLHFDMLVQNKDSEGNALNDYPYPGSRYPMLKGYGFVEPLGFYDKSYDASGGKTVTPTPNPTPEVAKPQHQKQALSEDGKYYVDLNDGYINNTEIHVTQYMSRLYQTGDRNIDKPFWRIEESKGKLKILVPISTTDQTKTISTTIPTSDIYIPETVAGKNEYRGSTEDGGEDPIEIRGENYHVATSFKKQGGEWVAYFYLKKVASTAVPVAPPNNPKPVPPKVPTTPAGGLTPTEKTEILNETPKRINLTSAQQTAKAFHGLYNNKSIDKYSNELLRNGGVDYATVLKWRIGIGPDGYFYLVFDTGTPIKIDPDDFDTTRGDFKSNKNYTYDGQNFRLQWSRGGNGAIGDLAFTVIDSL